MGFGIWKILDLRFIIHNLRLRGLYKMTLDEINSEIDETRKKIVIDTNVSISSLMSKSFTILLFPN